MLRRLYRCAVRLHPASFRRRFGEEMLYVFDQQRGMLAALGVMLDCIFSLLRQWTLRRHADIELPASPLRTATADHIPVFESLDTFQPRASAIIHGALLSVILFYMIVFAIPYSWTHVLNLRFAAINGETTPFTRNYKNPSERIPVNVIPTESAAIQSRAIALSNSRAAEPIRTERLAIWLEPYVGKYVPNDSSAKISIQIKNDSRQGDHLSLSLAAAGNPSFALSPVSPRRFVITGTENSYVEFIDDDRGRICCLSFVVNGKAITAQRE